MAVNNDDGMTVVIIDGDNVMYLSALNMRSGWFFLVTYLLPITF